MLRHFLSFTHCLNYLAARFVQRKPPVRPKASTIAASSLDSEVRDFLDRELTAHLDEIKSYDPAPGKVFNAGTTGEYTWGTFMYALGAYAQSLGQANTFGVMTWRVQPARSACLNIV